MTAKRFHTNPATIFRSQTLFSFSNIFSFLNLVSFLYLFYVLEKQISDLNGRIEQISNDLLESTTAVLDTFSVKISKQLSKSEDVIQNSFKKFNELERLVANNNSELFHSSEKVNKVLLKLIDLQSNPVSNVQVYSESNFKYYLLAAVIGLALTSAVFFVFIPKISTITVGKFLQLQFIADKVSKTAVVDSNKSLLICSILPFKSEICFSNT